VSVIINPDQTATIRVCDQCGALVPTNFAELHERWCAESGESWPAFLARIRSMDDATFCIERLGEWPASSGARD